MAVHFGHLVCLIVSAFCIYFHFDTKLRERYLEVLESGLRRGCLRFFTVFRLFLKVSLVGKCSRIHNCTVR